MERPTRWYDTITINIYWFALTTRAQVLTPLVIPLLVQQFVGEENKGTYYGIIRLWALMAAVLFQAMMGLLSDRSTLRWGRRRPFIAAGTIGSLIVIALIGFSSKLEGMAGYWVLLVLYLFSMATSDTAHAATQGLIPDLVPEEKRGFFSGVKALLELPVPLVFVSFVIGKLISEGNLWGALLALMAVLAVCMVLAMFVREQPQETPPFPFDWNAILRLVLMTGVFALIILGTGESVKWVLGQISDSPLGIVLTGVIGAVVAALLGVWVSVRIGVGQDIHKHPSYTWWVINRLIFMTAIFGLSGFMLYFLQERFPELQGESAAGPSATIMMFVGIFILITSLPSGWLADRFGKKRLITIASVVATLGMIVILLVPNPGALNIGGCLIGAAMGLFYAASWALGTQIVPQDQAARYLGLANLAGAGSGAIGAYIGGPIADTTSYVLLFTIYGTLFLLSTLSLIGIQEKKSIVIHDP
ncbi:MAG: MFS transporter [Anaerolineae bacterium]|nr:MFS transporter [Anaerolineae bacterium]